MTSILGRLLRGREPSREELATALASAERRREERRLAIEKLLVRRDHALRGIKEARRAGDDMLVDTLWEELEGLRADMALARRDAKVASLESRALGRYVRGLDHLAARGDREGVRRLLERARSSPLPDLLAREEIDEERYVAELTLLLGEAELAEEEEAADPRKDEFLKRLDRIADAEGAGRATDAAREESELKQELDDGTL